MIGKTNGGGGRDRFRPTVYGGTTAPAKPKNGDFWIYTNTKIARVEWNCWVHSFPGWEQSNGDVQIASGGFNESTFVDLTNIRNGLHYFCPNDCYQVEGGKWYRKNAYVYRNGAWLQFSSWAAPWNGELFQSGNQYTDHTGGWAYTFSDKGSVDFSSNIWWSVNNITAFVYTARTIDVTKYSRLRFTGSLWGSWSFGLGNKQSGLNAGNWIARIQGDGTVNDGSVDISGVSGSFYVVLYASAEGGSGGNISKVWLE